MGRRWEGILDRLGIASARKVREDVAGLVKMIALRDNHINALRRDLNDLCRRTDTKLYNTIKLHPMLVDAEDDDRPLFPYGNDSTRQRKH